MRAWLTWAVLAIATVVPFWFAANSPLLAWREPIYILAGFAGVIALVLMLFQPLLASGWLPGVRLKLGRRLHRWVGGTLVLAILTHVGGLWITSPPDVVDALTFVSPTPFSNWGVIAMWAIFGTATLALLRHRLRIRTWRLAHYALATLAVATTVPHVLLVDGTMETVSKTALSFMMLTATVLAVVRWKAWKRTRLAL